MLTNRRTAFLVITAVLLGSPAHADSSFRGFTVSDSPSQVEKIAGEEGLSVKWLPQPFATDESARMAQLSEADDACGWIYFDGKDKLERMRFAPCFFGAVGLGIQQIAQEFVDKFGGEAKPQYVAKPLCTDANPYVYVGKTDEGEMFMIEQDCGMRVEIKPYPKLKF